VAEVQRYRALCLLALNRTAEGKAIEVVLTRDPLYQLSRRRAAADAAAFNDAAPPKVSSSYRRGASFDRKDYALAATQFKTCSFLEERRAELPSLASSGRCHGFAISAQRRRRGRRRRAAPGRPRRVPPRNPPPDSTNGSAAAASTARGGPGALVPPVTSGSKCRCGWREGSPRGGWQVRIIDEQGKWTTPASSNRSTVHDALLLGSQLSHEPAKLDGKPTRYMKVSKSSSGRSSWSVPLQRSGIRQHVAAEPAEADLQNQDRNDLARDQRRPPREHDPGLLAAGPHDVVTGPPHRLLEISNTASGP
jgi:hypothetical protein